MAYKQNYYHVLGLEAPTGRSSSPAREFTIRNAYRRALFAAHPDKKTRDTGRRGGSGSIYTVDDVKEAFNVLGHKDKKEEFDRWLARTYEEGVVKYGDGEMGWADAFGNTNSVREKERPSSDFVLGLELLDLSDFEVVEAEGSTPGSLPLEEGQNTEWTRSCRCGADKGFRILEHELESASKRGDKEVLVGCEGCSLWVRVGFEVEEEDG